MCIFLSTFSTAHCRPLPPCSFHFDRYNKMFCHVGYNPYRIPLQELMSDLLTLESVLMAPPSSDDETSDAPRVSSPAAAEKPSPVISESTVEENGEHPVPQPKQRLKPGPKPGSKRKPKEFDPASVKLVDPSDFPERQEPDFKAKGFPDSTFQIYVAEEKAKQARCFASVITQIARAHCSNGMWPKKTLDDANIKAAEAEFKVEELKKAFAANKAQVKKNAEERKTKKKDSLDAFGVEIKSAFSDEFLNLSRTYDSPPTPTQMAEMMPKAKEAAIVILTEWAPQIISWTKEMVDKVCEVAAYVYIAEDEVHKILKEANTDDADDADDADDTKHTAKKAKRGESSSMASPMAAITEA